MLALRVYVTCSLNWVYLEVIANIKCYLFTRKTQFYGKEMLRSTANKSVNIFGKYQHFCFWCIYVWYCQHDMSYLPIFYSTTAWYKFLEFMLALLDIYFIFYIFVVAGKIANILCYITLITTTFQLKTKNEKDLWNLC